MSQKEEAIESPTKKVVVFPPVTRDWAKRILGKRNKSDLRKVCD